LMKRPRFWPIHPSTINLRFHLPQLEHRGQQRAPCKSTKGSLLLIWNYYRWRGLASAVIWALFGDTNMNRVCISPSFVMGRTEVQHSLLTINLVGTMHFQQLKIEWNTATLVQHIYNERKWIIV
jgi:hypothetical protein